MGFGAGMGLPNMQRNADLNSTYRSTVGVGTNDTHALLAGRSVPFGTHAGLMARQADESCHTSIP